LGSEAMRKSVLITGATGYIGRNLLHLWSFLDDLEIVRVDRTTGFDFSVAGWVDRLPDRKVDVIIHLAQSRRYNDFPDGSRDVFQVNVASTFELLEWARTHGVKRFVFASSGTVYEENCGKLKEDSASAPKSMYAASKLVAENLIQPYGVFIDVVILRLFGVYGPGQRQMIIPRMIEHIRLNKEIYLAGGTGIFLTPLFIEDCVKILSELTWIPMARGVTVLNVAGDEVLSLGEMVAIIGSKLGMKPQIQSTDEQPRHLCGDNFLLKSIVSWSHTAFDIGMDLTLKSRNNTLYEGSG
jgi:UDP-glucose 4-epimerase